MEETSSVEVSEESRRSSRVSLDTLHPVSHMLDSYMVPVVFDKTDECRNAKDYDADERGGKYACIIADKTKPKLQEALESLDRDVCYSSDGRVLPDHIPDNCDMVFICEKFQGEAYDYLHSRKLRILGPPCVMSCSLRQNGLPNSLRPIYSCVMEDVVICFTGFKDRVALQRLCSLAHQLGASIRKDMPTTITHIVAHTVNGSKYSMAVTRGTPIMSDDWVTECWKRRDDINASASKLPLSDFKQKPFTGCCIALHGFPTEEEKEMKEIAVNNGAVCGDLERGDVSHCVVSDAMDPTSYPVLSRVHLVKQQWFWESIQIEACADEQLYQAKESTHYHHHHHHHRHGGSRRSILTSSPTCRLRGATNGPSSLHNSISSIDISCLLEASLFSLSSHTPSKNHGKTKKSPGLSPLATTPTSTSGGTSASTHKMEESARRHIASEMLQTERNFVGILNTIVTIFKEPLERLDLRGGPILSHADIKSIFGNTPEILSVHRRLVAGLEEQLSNWCWGSCIGQVVLRQSDALLKVYPPFVNFFDLSKEALQRCDKMFPRFHAFLKSNESRPECGRQTLAELLITPVQRIPRIILLLKELVKRTHSQHSDCLPLQQAVRSLQTVMNHINEDRRKTEGQMQMFEMLRDVEGCPANILSSQRSFLRRVDVLDIGNPNKGTKGDPFSIFIFSDSLEVAKRRMTSGFGLRNTQARMFKHLQFIHLTHIRSLVQFGDTGEYSNSFGVLMHSLDDPVEKLLVFRLSGGGVASGPAAREEVVQQIARLMASSIFSTDTEKFIVNSTAETLNSMCKTGVSSTPFKKALHGARKKVFRAFSGRNGRKQNLSSTSVHQNLHEIGEENEVPLPDPEGLRRQDMPHPPSRRTAEENAKQICMLMESPNTSIMSTISAMTPSLASATPVTSLRIPRPKRPALSRLPSFSAADLTNVGTEVKGCVL